MIHFNCPTCGKSFNLRDEHTGRKGKCSCGAVITIPGAGSGQQVVQQAGTTLPATETSKDKTNAEGGARLANLKCKLGCHKWDGCTCTECGKTRKQDHDWGENCERCSRCGAARENAHSWNGCKCKACGSVRDQGHDWKRDCERCSRCGAVRKGGHQWDGCKCKTCGEVRNQHHHWKDDCEHCARCGAIRKRAHDWKADCEHCSKCGATRAGAHSLSDDCERCSRCGAMSGTGHQWEGCKCKTCGKTRDQEHSWDGCACSRCGKTPPAIPPERAAVLGELVSLISGPPIRLQQALRQWGRACGTTRGQDHSWDGCVCRTCGTSRNQDHDWSKDCERCCRCGATRTDAHQWDGCRCYTCPKTRDQDHEFRRGKGGKCFKCDKRNLAGLDCAARHTVSDYDNQIREAEHHGDFECAAVL